MKLKVIDKKLEIKSYFSLILEKPTGFSFYPGQYLDIELPIQGKVTSDRIFTISSSSTESFLMITSKTGISNFKESMEGLKAGDTISVSHPTGTFTLDESSPAVFIAGGIGITPFRSMIKYVLDNKLHTPMTLIYSNSDNKFPFKKELDSWLLNLPNLTIHYVITSKEGRLNRNDFLKLYPKPFTLNPIFYLAGPPNMVNRFEEMLLGLRVDEVNIRYDRFDGY